jgi:hypothetical protein
MAPSPSAALPVPYPLLCPPPCLPRLSAGPGYRLAGHPGYPPPTALRPGYAPAPEPGCPPCCHLHGLSALLQLGAALPWLTQAPAPVRARATVRPQAPRHSMHPRRACTMEWCSTTPWWQHRHHSRTMEWCSTTLASWSGAPGLRGYRACTRAGPAAFRPQPPRCGAVLGSWCRCVARFYAVRG